MKPVVLLLLTVPLALCQSTNNPGQASWTDADGLKVMRTVVNSSLDTITSRSKVFDRQPRPGVNITIANEETPPFIRNGTIFMVLEYLRHLDKLSSLLAHDLALRTDGPVTVARPLLQHPFASSPLLPLLRPFKTYFGEDVFFGLADIMPCRLGAKCDLPHDVIFSTMLDFVLAHEMAHAFRGDSGSDLNYPIDVELGADRKAWELLSSLPRSGHNTPEDDREMSIAFAAAALLEIDYYKEISGGKAVASDITRRYNALAALMPPEIRQEAMKLTENREVVTTGGGIRLSWSEKPDLLLVNGVLVGPDEVANGSLLGGLGPVRVFARKAARLAWAQQNAGPSSPVPLALRFEDLRSVPAPIPDLGAPDSSRSQRSWFEILLGTSDGNLHPKNPRLAMSHYRALAALGLYDLIPETPDVPLSEENRKILAEWRRAGAPAAAWRR